MHYLFAADEVAAGGAIGATLLVVGALGAWVIRLKKAAGREQRLNRAQDSDEKRKDRELENTQELSLLDQAINRIAELEKRDVEKDHRLMVCETDRASLRKEIEWLNRFVGKAAKTPSGSHRPLHQPSPSPTPPPSVEGVDQ